MYTGGVVACTGLSYASSTRPDGSIAVGSRNEPTWFSRCPESYLPSSCSEERRRREEDSICCSYGYALLSTTLVVSTPTPVHPLAGRRVCMLLMSFSMEFI